MREPMTYYTLTQLPSKQPAAGVEMRALHGERMSLALFRIARGAVVPEHSHPHEQIGTVLAGEMELSIAGDTRVVPSGGAYHIPSHTVHSARCLKGPAEVIEVFSPVREDWRGA
jgi:quercetin dioxygenase-like cupin family protein